MSYVPIAVPDESAFVAGTSPVVPVGGVFNDALPALSPGETGEFRITERRALHSNLRREDGTEMGVAAAPLQVSLANTAANAVPVAVADASADSSLTTIAGATSTLAGGVSGGAYSENLIKLAGTAVDVNSGNKSAGTQRVVLATDQPALTNPLLVNTVPRTPKVYFANNINATQSNIITGATLYAIKSILIAPRASSSAVTGANYFILLSDSSGGIFLIINVWMAAMNAQPSAPIIIGPSNQPFFQSVVSSSTLTLTINSAPTGGGMDVTIGYELIP